MRRTRRPRPCETSSPVGSAVTGVAPSAQRARTAARCRARPPTRTRSTPDSGHSSPAGTSRASPRRAVSAAASSSSAGETTVPPPIAVTGVSAGDRRQHVAPFRRRRSRCGCRRGSRETILRSLPARSPGRRSTIDALVPGAERRSQHALGDRQSRDARERRHLRRPRPTADREGSDRAPRRLGGCVGGRVPRGRCWPRG